MSEGRVEMPVLLRHTGNCEPRFLAGRMLATVRRSAWLAYMRVKAYQGTGAPVRFETDIIATLRECAEHEEFVEK